VPVPKWVAKVNKHTFNKAEIKRGKRPVLTHVGRRSGRSYHTPMDAHGVDGGFVFFPMYGPDSDWVMNVLAAGTASVSKDGADYDLTNPRLISRNDARQQVAAGTKMPPEKLNIDQYLQMDLAG
jgi:deazaflavin-dependent oxidoreductase (nitroreductase family)